MNFILGCGSNIYRKSAIRRVDKDLCLKVTFKLVNDPVDHLKEASIAFDEDRKNRENSFVKIGAEDGEHTPRNSLHIFGKLSGVVLASVRGGVTVVDKLYKSILAALGIFAFVRNVVAYGKKLVGDTASVIGKVAVVDNVLFGYLGVYGFIRQANSCGGVYGVKEFSILFNK